MAIESLNAITLTTRDMARALQFYISLGFQHAYGGPDDSFASFHVGRGHLNLDLDPDYAAGDKGPWGRVIFYVSDVDAIYQLALERGLQPSFEPRDADWGERYFHISDPDGHEISFAQLLDRPAEPKTRSEELAERAIALYRESKPRLDQIVARARPRAEEASRQAMRFAREHEGEIRQAADALARTRMPGGIGAAANALASQVGGPKQPGRKCGSCQTLNPATARFCSECGTRLPLEAPPEGPPEPDGQ